MKTIMIILALTTTSLLIGMTYQGKLSTSDNFQLLTKDGETFQRGENIRLKVVIKNTSKKLQKLSVTQPEMDYVITAKNEAGTAMPMSKYGEAMKKTETISRNFVAEIKPGSEMQEEIPIDKLYTPFPKGMYEITIQRYILRNGNKGTTITSPIVVKIKIAE